ncbi:MAG: DUF3667 domain-containing protein [Prevotella sp.]|nr:DUF3667 domain-containing protein [Prevotella sp.]
MKALEYISNKDKRAVWMRAYHIWQRRPHELAPLSEEMHTCSSCGTAFQGNYCPRCGQSARIGRFSFKKAALLFLDVWGMGNRSMFRSIRDLMFRPGYMIRDYLKGMQSAYFPPFKMFFLLAALSLLVEHGFSLTASETATETEIEVNEETEKDETERQLTVNGQKVEPPMYHIGMKFVKSMDSLEQKNPAIFSLLMLLMFTIPLYFFLRHSPVIPDLRYSEFVVALVYTSNTFSIYSIAGNLLDSRILKLIAVLIVFVALKQLSGYSKRRVLGYIVLTVLISTAVLMTLVGTYIYIIYLLYGK